jgi:alginate O-acetyltransferase complex protein AlgI
VLGGAGVLFNSQPFILGFLPVVLGGFFLLGRLCGATWALCWLVAASLFFYGWWNPLFVLLLAGSIVGNYFVGQRIFRLVRGGDWVTARLWLITGVAGDLGVLGWFKYAGFAASNIAAVLDLRVQPLHVFLPLAISFFTFQQIMFLVDSFHDQRAETGFLPYAAFVAFFPHLIAGPIVRPKEVLPQLAAATMAVPRSRNLSAGLTIFLLGLAKKLVLADMFARFSDVGFDAAAHGASLTFFEA